LVRRADGEHLRYLSFKANSEMSGRDMKVMPPVSTASHSLRQGEQAPPFELIDPMAGTLRSADLLRSGSVLLTFYRGAWCGCCQADLHDLAQAIPQLDQARVVILGVFHDLTREANFRIRKIYNLGFPVVDDPGGRAAEAFGIRRSSDDIAEIESQFGPELLALKEGQPWIIPMQARYMILRDGVIARAEIVTDYTHRSSIASLLTLLGRA
jgi:peroxiredoxin